MKTLTRRDPRLLPIFDLGVPPIAAPDLLSSWSNALHLLDDRLRIVRHVYHES